MNNFIKRSLVAIIGIPVMIGGALLGGIWFFLLVAIISFGIIYEFFRMVEKKEILPLRWVGVGGLAGILIFFGYDTFTQMLEFTGTEIDSYHFLLVVLLLFVLVSLSTELFVWKGASLANLGVTALGVLYVGIGMGTFLGLREFFDNGLIILLILFSIWVCDTAAYLGGKTFGKHKLYHAVSPNKTVEGAIFGLIFAIATSIACKYFFVEYIQLIDAVVIGLIVGVIGQIGDLAESMFKREVGVKDSSSFFPGHGGFLDRFDSILFVSPAVYLYVLLSVM